ncbi:MAG: translation initiation factor IF-2 [Ruminococcaceae bacterium]|nr:translation initiation factor IF-2 [Oscillospiraceae bacterium]
MAKPKNNNPRVHEISKFINVSSKDLIALLESYGVECKNHMTTLEYKHIDIILTTYLNKYDRGDTIEEYYNTLKAEKAEEAAKKAKKEGREPEVVAEPAKEEEIDLASLEIKKETNQTVVDTRQSNVDLEKLDTGKIEQLVDIDKVEGKSQKKQKIKKNNSQVKKPEKEFVNNNKKKKEEPKDEGPKVVLVPDEISVGDLSERMGLPATAVVKKLFELGIMASISQNVDFDTAVLIGEDLGFKIEKEIIITDEDRLFNDVEDAEEDLEPRSPVVVVMGHVDHGKTSLLDAIRNTNVIAKEAGGITQHIGAYRVRVGDKKVTFLDTPGHEAFTAMRMRGAQVTDVAILVVAADDGIMPQTVEAINHAKAAGVTIIVAINKIDKEAANPDRIKQELTEYELVPEEWGGSTICVPISAKFNKNIDELLEMVTLVADMKELKANPNRKAKGTVIEARLDKGRGPVATVLVQNGTLRSGDIIVAGTAVGRVRAMVDDRGNTVKKAGPSVPVEIIGLSEVPEGGDIFYAVDDERKARDVVEKRKQKAKEEAINARTAVSLDDLFNQIQQGEVKDLNIIVKADVQGSVEAVKQSLSKLSNEEVRVNCIHGGVGGVTESDVMLAAASNAIIVGFNVRPAGGALESAKANDVDVRFYRVIYHAIEEIEAAMKGMLAPKFREALLGHAEVRSVFKVSGVGAIAGGYVQDGKISRNSQVRIVRDNIIIHEGVLSSLRRFKDDVKEVASGYECGIGIENYNDIKEGDVIESFIMEEIKE